MEQKTNKTLKEILEEARKRFAEMREKRNNK